MINVLIEIKTKDLDDVKVKKEEDVLSKLAKEALKDSTDDKWKSKDKGADKYQLLSLNLPRMAYAVEIESMYNGAKILGAWDFEGEIIIPPHVDLLSYCQDDVVYNDQGQEVSRTAAIKLKQTHKWFGQKDRKWV